MIKIVNGIEVAPGPNWHSLYRWVVSQAAEFLAFQTVYLVTDNRDLLADTVANTPGLGHWPMVAAWWKERIQYVGPYGERSTVVFVPISADTGLDRVHPTWAGTYILDACVFLFPAINFALIDSDCVPVTLFEIQELWLSCTGHNHPAECCPQPKPMPSSPIAPAHKRARSIGTGRATQQPGPSYPNREVFRILLPLKRGHRLQMLLAALRMRLTLVDQNRRVPSQLNAKN